MYDEKKELLKKVPRIDLVNQLITPFVIVDPFFNPYQNIDRSQAICIPMRDVLANIQQPQHAKFAIVSHDLELPSTLHYHDYIEIVYLPAGKVLNVVDHSPFIMEDGSLFILKQHTAHLVARLPESADKLILVNILIHPQIFDQFAKEQQQTTTLTDQLFNFGDYLIYHQEDLMNVHYYLHRLIAEYQQADFQFSYTVLGYLMIFLEQLVQLQRPAQCHYDELTTTILQRIKADPLNSSLAMLSSELNYSNGYLSRHIKEQTQKTISQWIADEKLALAEQYLSETKMTISTIAEMVNYQSESHFYRLFKEKFHLTPKQYRNLYQ